MSTYFLKGNHNNLVWLKREDTISSHINNPSIIKFIGFNQGSFNNKNNPTIVTEFYSKGTIESFIKASDSNIDGTTKLIFICGIASGIAYLHSQNILH